VVAKVFWVVTRVLPDGCWVFWFVSRVFWVVAMVFWLVGDLLLMMSFQPEKYFTY